MLQRLALVGLLLGLLVMHGFAHSGPATAVAHPHQTIVSMGLTGPCESTPRDRDLPASPAFCLAVLGGVAVPSLVGPGELPDVTTGASSVDPVSSSGSRVERPHRTPLPDRAALCVLRI
jgi:hypothetical protein